MPEPVTDTVITPVILPVPDNRKALRGREKVTFLSAYARSALALCAERMGIHLPPLEKNDNGAPIARGGIHWSVTHKSAYVGAVIAHVPIGIDIERIRPFQAGLFEKIATDREWTLTGRTNTALARLWSAKEAVLKSAGTGIGHLSQCRVSDCSGDDRIIIAYQNRLHPVRLYALDDHVAAVVDIGCPVKWHVVDRPLTGSG